MALFAGTYEQIHIFACKGGKNPVTLLTILGVTMQNLVA
jgi:hypothetical protein